MWPSTLNHPKYTKAYYKVYLIYCLRADVSYFLCCTRATKEIADVCTQATLYIERKTFTVQPMNGHKLAHGPHRRDVTHILCKVSCFSFLNPFILVGYRNDRFFRKYLYSECYATMPMLADAHISSLGYLC